MMSQSWNIGATEYSLCLVPKEKAGDPFLGGQSSGLWDAGPGLMVLSPGGWHLSLMEYYNRKKVEGHQWCSPYGSRATRDSLPSFVWLLFYQNNYFSECFKNWKTNYINYIGNTL